MAPLPNLVRQRALPISHLKSSIHHISPVVLAVWRVSTGAPCVSRQFWWGRCGNQHKAASKSEAYQRRFEARSRISRLRAGKSTMLPTRFYPVSFCRGHGWRLASSQGGIEKESDKAPEDKGKEEITRDNEWATESEKWRNELNVHLERIRKQMEDYPYETMFGRSMKNGVWNPWGIDLDYWMRSLSWNELTGGKVSKTKSREGFPTTGVAPKSKERRDRSTDNIEKDPPGEDGEIDLITLRRVPKEASKAPVDETEMNNNNIINIPVKTFRSSSRTDVPPTKCGKPTNPEFASALTDTSSSKPSIGGDPTRHSPMKNTGSVPAPQTWLTRERFSERDRADRKTSRAVISSDERDTELATKSENLLDRYVQKDGLLKSKSTPQGTDKLESSLDRHVRKTPPSNSEPFSKLMVPDYRFEDNKAEDVDLLRASDIRASSGRLKNQTSKPTSVQEEHWRNLESSFDKQQNELDARYTAEIESTPVTRISTTSSAFGKAPSDNGIRIKAKAEDSAVMEAMNLNKITSQEPSHVNLDAGGYDLNPKGLETSYRDELKCQHYKDPEDQNARRWQGLGEAEERQNEQKRKAADAVLADEIKSQTAAMSAFETKPRGVVKYSIDEDPSRSDEGGKLSGMPDPESLPGWYKERDANKAKELALVREIRGIYEQEYGQITSMHRQPVMDQSMGGRLDPAVQNGLREYDEELATKCNHKPAEGRLAGSDLSQEEVALLTNGSQPSQTSSPSPAPSRSLETAANRKSPGPEPEPTDNVAPAQNNRSRQLPECEEIDGTNSKRAHDLSLKYRVIIKEVLETLEETLGVVKKVLAKNESTGAHVSAPVSGTSDSKATRQFKPSISTYTVLAFDSSIGTVRTATSTSSLGEPTSSTRSPSSILAYLENPIKYFDHLEFLEASGYELVAGSRESLVFKKMYEEDQNDLKSMQATIKDFLEKRSQEQVPVTLVDQNSAEGNDQLSEAHGITVNQSAELPVDSLTTPATSSEGQQHKVESAERTYFSSPNPIDGTIASKPSTASNLGFSETTTPLTTTSSYLAASQAGKFVRREEDVFSGQSRTFTREQYKERRRQQRLADRFLRNRASREESRQKRKELWKNTKRMFWTGLWVAGCLYMVGALLEEIYRPKKERGEERERRRFRKRRVEREDGESKLSNE